MYRLRVGQRVVVRENSDWTFVEEAYVGRSGCVVGHTAGAIHPTNECYNVVLDGEGTRVFCFCFHDLRVAKQ
jgi:hypothetical protein